MTTRGDIAPLLPIVGSAKFQARMRARQLNRPHYSIQCKSIVQSVDGNDIRSTGLRSTQNQIQSNATRSKQHHAASKL